MPTIATIEGHRFFFYSEERQEQPHIHVAKAENRAKIWLEPVEIAGFYGYNKVELRKVERIIGAKRQFSWRNGMSILRVRRVKQRARRKQDNADSSNFSNGLGNEEIAATRATFDKLHMFVTLADNRVLKIPLSRFPHLQKASPAQREGWRLKHGGQALRWDDLDEDIYVPNLLLLPSQLLRYKEAG